MTRGFVVALLGAESTGKTTLARELCEMLRSEGSRVELVGEYLRVFCERHQRTPHVEEQAGIAAEQTRRIDEAATCADIVIADTTALMIAVYSDFVFADLSLYDTAIDDHRRCDLTLVTALDLPWQHDGLQREGPHVQGPIDARVRGALQKHGLGYAVVAGHGSARLDSAMKAVRHAIGRSSRADDNAANPPWQWLCERCGDVGCERHLFRFSPE